MIVGSGRAIPTGLVNFYFERNHGKAHRDPERKRPLVGSSKFDAFSSFFGREPTTGALTLLDQVSGPGERLAIAVLP
jgi:hypothetical protein